MSPEIVCSVVEHHSNLLPWQIVAKNTAIADIFKVEGDDEA